MKVKSGSVVLVVFLKIRDITAPKGEGSRRRAGVGGLYQRL